MTVYNIARPPFPDAGCHVYDRDGNELFHVQEFDTETGRVVRRVLTDTGFLLVEPDTVKFTLETAHVPAPLRVEKCDATTGHPCSKEDPRHRAPGRKYRGCTCAGKIVTSTCPVRFAHERDAKISRELARRSQQVPLPDRRQR